MWEEHPQHSPPVVESSGVSFGTFEGAEIAGVPDVADLVEEVVEALDVASHHELELEDGLGVEDVFDVVVADALADLGVAAAPAVGEDLAATPICLSPPPSSSSSPHPHKYPCISDLPRYPVRS